MVDSTQDLNQSTRGLIPLKKRENPSKDSELCSINLKSETEIEFAEEDKK